MKKNKGRDGHKARASDEFRFNLDGASAVSVIEEGENRKETLNEALVLVFIPLIAAQGWADHVGWSNAFMAFFALCCAASSVYLFNDAFDIPADRRHPRKRNRPFASGALSPARGLAVSVALTVVALLVGWAAGVALYVLSYIALSGLYTVWLKRLVIVDIFVLASLYGLRVLLGGVASGHPASSWMLAFCGFFFLSLAVVKRVSEIEGAPENIRRGYTIADAPVLKAMGVRRWSSPSARCCRREECCFNQLELVQISLP